MIDGAVGSLPINVASAFLLGPKEKKKVIPLPASVYPPHWAQRKGIEETIITAAREQANTELIRQANMKVKNYVVLACKYGRRLFRGKKYGNPTSDEIYHPEKFDVSSQYQAGVRLDPMVNKAAGIRGTSKHEGKSFVRRCASTKPPLENTCSFKITLRLLPGKHWYISCRQSDNGCHNHLLVSHTEMARRTNTMTQEESKHTQVVGTYANGGSAQNILNSQTGFTFTQQQIRYKRQKEDLMDGTLPGESYSNSVSSATKLMAYL